MDDAMDSSGASKGAKAEKYLNELILTTANYLDLEISERLRNIVSSARELKEKGKKMFNTAKEAADQHDKDVKKMGKAGKHAVKTGSKVAEDGENMLKNWNSRADERMGDLRNHIVRGMDKDDLDRLALEWAANMRAGIRVKIVKLENKLDDLKKALDDAEASSRPPEQPHNSEEK